MVSNREKGNDYFLHSFTGSYTHPHTCMRTLITRICVYVRVCVGAGEGMKE